MDLKFNKQYIWFWLLLLAGSCNSQKQVVQADLAEYNLPADKLSIRDPHIVVDKRHKKYYVHASTGKGFKVYTSKDLQNWKDLGYSFQPDLDFWGKQDFWAPDVAYYKGKYYMLATFSAPGVKRGTSILVADRPVGPFRPLINKAITPANLMCLDGTLFIDPDKKPWLIYSHEWLEAIDGEVIAQQLSPNLKRAIGEPIILFTAGKAPWGKAITAHGVTGYVTDSPVPYRTKNGHLIMLWSGFNTAGKYVIGVARSKNGDIKGPWIHDPLPLNEDDGGHAMLFQDFAGQLHISYHSPNSGGREKLKIARVSEVEGRLKIIK